MGYYSGGKSLGLLIDYITKKTHDNWWFLLIVLAIILVIFIGFSFLLTYF